MKIGFIGAGNMGSAVFKGFIKNNAVKAEDIYVYRLNKEKLMKDVEEFGINPVDTYEELIEKTECIFLAIKPNKFNEVLPKISHKLREKNSLTVSMAAGKTIESIEQLLGYKAPIIRMMPNINAQICLSATAYCCNEKVTKEQLEFVKKCLEAIGMTTEVEESKFATFTAIAGCSPAYVYMFIEALAKGALKAGMNKKQALDIASYAVFGSAKMFIESDMHPNQLIDKVCSPGGTTIEGVCTLDEYKFTSGIVKAVENSIEKDKKLN